MRLKNLKFLTVPVLLTTLFAVVSCNSTGPITWNPDFYAHDYETQSIVDERGAEVFCNEINFNDYASLSKEKIKELIVILKKARMPKSLKSEKLKFIMRLQEAVNEN